MSYGFVYIWRDRLRKRFYVGSHHGPEDDGYVGSSEQLRRAFKKRPHDFKRRILARNDVDDGKLTRQLEEQWLTLIKLEELGVRYYNLKRCATGGNLYEGLSPEQMEEVSKKLSLSRTGEKHHSARAVMIDGKRYETKLAAHRALGLNPTRRLASKSLRWRDWYYEDIGQTAIEECETYDIEFKKKQREHLTKLARQEHAPEWYADRNAKGLPKRTGTKRKGFGPIARANMRKGHLGKKHTLDSIRKMAESRRLFWERKKKEIPA